MSQTAMIGWHTEADVVQNLRAAGCCEDTIRSFMDSYQAGRQKESLRILEAHRRALLDAVHAEERKIDCLDYLTDEMRKAEDPK